MELELIYGTIFVPRNERSRLLANYDSIIPTAYFLLALGSSLPPQMETSNIFQWDANRIAQPVPLLLERFAPSTCYHSIFQQQVALYGGD
jgi:hypothetical protein